MDEIAILEGDDLWQLLSLLGVENPKGSKVYRLRIHQAPDGNGIKVKVNESTWTYWLGEKNAT
jgi:hypothetical protein